MFARYWPVTATLLIISSSWLPAAAQLPSTNMGKFVHQPGDNQYSQETQAQRHGAGKILIARPVSQGLQESQSLPPTPPPCRPDISIEPISADEPVPPSGFPPLPDRLDLPVAVSAGWKNASSRAYAGSRAASSERPVEPTFHQHYAHVPPGYFLKPEQSAGSGAAGDVPGNAGGHGYYKVRTPGAGGDYCRAGSAGGPPRYAGASARDIRALGPEPRLNDHASAAPAVPAPVTVDQARTTDLSLPEDEFSYQARQPNRFGRSVGRGALRVITQPLNYVGGMAGFRF